MTDRARAFGLGDWLPVTTGESGAIVTLACDPGERYLDSYYDPAWLAEHGYDLEPKIARFRRFFHEGIWE